MIARLMDAGTERLQSTTLTTRVVLGALVLTAAIFAIAPRIVSADRQITNVVLTPATVGPGGAIEVSVTIEADGNVPEDQNEWGSTAWGFTPNELSCIDQPDNVGAESGTFTHDFSIDAPNEPGEFELLLKIFGAEDCGGGQASGIARTGVTVTVVDVEISIDDIEVTEGDSGDVEAVFTVTLSVASTETVTVAFATDDGSATAGNDYTATSGTLRFDPGDTEQTITVTVLGDTTDEPDENYFVNLSAATNATIADEQGLGTILDDDVEIAIDDVEVTEGDSGIVNAIFEVTLSRASAEPVTVDWATADGSATTAGDDYTGDSGTLTFDPGETSKLITVAVLGDTLSEPNETFVVNLSNASNATIADDQGEGTILDDDGVVITISDVSTVEGDSGTTNAVFTVSLSVASTSTVTVNFATANGSAAAGVDYVAADGTLTFTPGDTSETVTVAVLSDTLDEADETYVVNLSAATNATIGDAQGLGTILDDDGVTISINNVTVVEGDSGFVNAVFTVTLSQISSQTITVNFATANNGAVASLDYLFTAGALIFLPGELSRSIVVAVIGDESDESDELFAVLLSGAVNATIADRQGTGTILDDDDGPVPVPVVSDNDGDHGAKVTLCHIPPGNPDKAHTISVGAPAVDAHLAHGDTLEDCP